MSRRSDDIRTRSGKLVKGFDAAKHEDAIYLERLAWKFGSKVAHNASCRVCGSAMSQHGRPALICPTADRLPNIPEVPASLLALTLRTYQPIARKYREPDYIRRVGSGRYTATADALGRVTVIESAA